MRNSIVLLLVVLSALLITPSANARDIGLDDAPSAGLCCFQGPKDWPKLDGVTNRRPEIQVILLDIDDLGLGFAPRDDVKIDLHLSTTLALSSNSTRNGSVTLPSCYYAVIQPPAADFEFDTIRLDFADPPLGFGISMEDSAQLIFAGVISAPLSYPSAAFNTN